MKKICLSLFAFFCISSVFAQQGFGVGLGYGTSKSGMANLEYFLDANVFSLGFTYQSNHELGKKADEALPNAIIGNGKFFYSADLGYQRIVSDHFSIGGEVSLGRRRYYTNYTDNSFSAGGFHTINETKTVIGVGGIITYNVSERFGIFAGYNSLREAAFGIQLKFLPITE